MPEAKEIIVDRPVLIRRDTIRFPLRYSASAQRYFASDAFEATYVDEDLSDVPEAIRLVPLLANLAPIAWAVDAQVRVDAVDATFLHALEAIKAALAALHPSITWRGAITADAAIAAPAGNGDGSALLFSGGVDSLTSYALHRAERPLLITVWGPLMSRLPVERTWEPLLRRNLAFANRHEAPIRFVKSNLQSFYRVGRLPWGRAPYFRWWEMVQHGPGLLGMCAPLAYRHGIRTVYIASSSNNKEAPGPWGSHPTVDGRLAWADVQARHDGLHLTRQEKMMRLAEFIAARDPELFIRVCWKTPDVNCSHCGKCFRTMVGLAAAGADPNRHGFHFDAQTIAQIQRRLQEIGTIGNPVYWQDIQEHLRAAAETTPTPAIEGLDAFFSWLKTATIAGFPYG